MCKPDDRLIIALDTEDCDAASAIVDQIDANVSFFKIGLGLLARDGLSLATRLKKSGKKVFLDLKLFDISATVESAVSGFVDYQPDFITVHGDPHVVSAAVAGRGDSPTRILAVTFLTSLDRSDLDDCLYRDGSIEKLIQERTLRALQAGADGVVASPREAKTIRKTPGAGECLIVTPGIRPAGSDEDDQKRTSSPGAAIAAGATHLVVGRPVTRSPDPLASVQGILHDMKTA